MADEWIIMGVDPGTLVTGYGVIVTDGVRHEALDFGAIKPPRKADISQRYLVIYNGLLHLLEKFKPKAVAVETQFVYKNPQSAIKLGMARGMAVLASAHLEIPLFEYAPTKAKLAVVGTGAASKAQVRGMIQGILQLPEPPEPEDAADALALAICHAHSLRNV